MGGKVLFFGWAFVVPALFHPFENVLLFYATTSFLIGLVLSVVFQLAHCVEEADFPVPQPEGYRLRRGWAVHQVQTTVDFAPRNRWLGWYVSGLNFQIEHHLFPRICHLHYPRLAEIVEATCAEFGVRYTAHQGLWGALSSHWRWLRRMGRPSPPAAVPNPGQRVPIAIKAIGAQDAPSVASVVLALDERPHAAPESVELLDGGRQTYPRMLHAVARAKKTVLLEVYSFAFVGIGARFVEALGHAAGRGVDVQVVLDGWGSARGGRAIAAALRESGCTVRIHNRLRVLFAGRFGRNHRKILIVDDEVAFLGGINIGDENLGNEARAGWADLALEIRGPQSERLGKLIRGEALRPIDSSLRLYICGPGGGWRLRQRYLSAFANARRQIHLAHGYFLPDLGVIRALTAASRRGVQVRLLLAGQSDVPLARAATRSVHRRLLAAGVNIHEWNGSVLHAKVAAVDGRLLLVGSFNLDPFSLANMETLVEVDDHTVVGQGEKWIEDHLGRSRAMTSVEASSRLRRWLLDPFGYGVAHVAAVVGRAIARESWPSKA
jgi:cardiolipin synthase